MLICVAGDIHGRIERMYGDVLSFEHQIGMQFDYVLQVGDFGVWPDPDRIDRATRRHEGAGDFAAWLRAGRSVPRRTVFIKGNHEDFEWLNRANSPELLPGLTWLPNGHSLELSDPKAGVLRIGGIGGCYGASDYERTARKLQGYARRHYTHDEVAKLASAPRIDILMTHDAPAGIRFEKRGGAHVYVSNAAGLDTLLSKTRPRLCLFGHHHARVNADIAGVRCVGLNCIGRAGNLVALDMDVGSGDWSVRAEFPPVTKKPRECREGCGDVNALEQTTERDIEEAWNCEIDRRAAQLDSGTAETIPWETARARLRRAVQA